MSVIFLYETSIHVLLIYFLETRFNHTMAQCQRPGISFDLRICLPFDFAEDRAAHFD